MPRQAPLSSSTDRIARLLPALLALGAMNACGGEPGEDSPSVRASTTVERDVLDLVTAVTPLPATTPPAQQHTWHARRRETLERLRRGDAEVGREALRTYERRADAVAEVRMGLLDVAAHTAPEATRPLLVELVSTFGDDIGLRTLAARLLGATSPETALEVLEPILRHEDTGRTYPPEDRLLQAWLDAADALGEDPTPLLCLVATDVSREVAVRNLAAKRLGELPSPRGRQALEQLLVESSGNHLIRRSAAQSLQRSLPPEELCALLRRTLDREADLAFQQFLDNMLVTHCR